CSVRHPACGCWQCRSRCRRSIFSSIGTTGSTMTRPIAGCACSSSRPWARLHGPESSPEIARVSLDAKFDTRPTVDQPDDDPYLWLEDLEGRRALAWVEAETDRTLKTFANARFAADSDTLAAI